MTDQQPELLEEVRWYHLGLQEQVWILPPQWRHSHSTSLRIPRPC